MTLGTNSQILGFQVLTNQTKGKKKNTVEKLKKCKVSNKKDKKYIKP